MKMVVVSSREFRANQRKYFDLALTNDVVITSRAHGSYRLVPIKDSDTLIDQDTLETKIRRGIEEYEQGKVHRKEEGESMDNFLERLVNEE
jgi:PHD/YefM family antitoxin component YafN of YafNO toxin-antitoxin module